MCFDDLNLGSGGWASTMGALFVFVVALAGCGDDSGDHGGAGDVVDAIDAAADAGGDGAVDGRTDSTRDPDGAGGDTRTGDVRPPRDSGDGDPAGDATVQQLRIDKVTPPRGSVDGGTPFVIVGAGFTEDTVVYFGSRRAEVTRVDGTLVGETPAGGATGPVNVKLLDPDKDAAQLAAGYTYTATVRITGVSPTDIPTEGGVEVSVAGRGFTADTRISFGGATGIEHTLVDDSLMRIVAPPHAAGAVDVRASSPDGSAVLTDGAIYFEALDIDRVRPASGAAAGGETVTVYGAGFVSGMTIEFGGAAATVQSVDATGTEAEVVTPAGSSGLTDVRAETPDGDATIASDVFYYRSQANAFAIAAVDPPTAPASGGVDVTIVGAGLDASSLAVTFGSTAASVVDNGPGHATVTVPAHAVGAVDVAISKAAGATETLAGAFTYVDDLVVDQIAPRSASVAGGASATIHGKGLTGVQRVEFGGVAAPFTVVSDTEISVTVPAHAAGRVDVVVERDIAARIDGFTYTEELQIFGFDPVRGSIAGQTYVEIRGRGFSGSVDAEFGGQAAEAVQILDGQTLAVRTPAHPSGGVNVVVDRDTDSVTAGQPYTFFNPGSRSGGTWGGPIRGAVNVSVYQAGGSPIPNAHVQLSTRQDSLYQGNTDPNGMITLSGPDVYGEQTVTAVAAEYSSATVQHVNAENITIFLSKSSQGPPGDGPPTATFEGHLGGLDKIKEPGPNEFQMAVVRTTRPDPWTRVPDPGSGATVQTDGPYTLNSRIGDVAVVAVGGLYNNDTQSFEPLAMGVERYLFASEGQTQTVDLELNIRLDDSVAFKINGASLRPDGPDVNRVVPWLDFGYEGVYGGLPPAQGTTDVIQADKLPSLEGDLSDASYWAIGGSYTTGNGPLAESFKQGITATGQVVDMPALPAIARVTTPASGSQPVNGLVSFQANAVIKPDFYYIQVLTFRRKVVWEGFLNGRETSFHFPNFPDFSNLPADQRPVPYPGGAYQLAIIGVRQQGASINNYSYSNLTLDTWKAYSVWSQVISF